MPYISGIYYRNERPADAQVTTLARATCKDEVVHFASRNILLFAQQNTTNLYTDAETGLTLVGDIDIYNIDELAIMLGHKGDSGEPNREEKLIIKAYKKWGSSCATHFSGDFTFVIWDENAQTLFCARDHIGHKPFYYYLDENIFIFSSHIHFLQNFGFSANIDEEYIRRMLLKPSPATGRDKTIYSSISRLLPAHTITIGSGKHTIEKYWDLNNKKQQKTTKNNNIEEGAETLRWYIDNAVKQRMPTDSLSGIELSGGLDSSAVAAFGQQYLQTHNKGLLAFSNALPASHKTYYNGFRDESDRIEIIKNNLGIKQHINIDHLGNNPVDVLEKGIEYIGYPSSVMINISQQPIYTVAREQKVTTLFSGFGGDEMVSANLYNIYVDLLIRSGKLQKASVQVQGHGYSAFKSYAHVYKQYAKHLLHIEETSAAQIESDEIERLIFHDNFIKTKEKENTRINSIREWYQYKMNYPGLLERLETGYLITANYGLKYKYPLLDVALLEYFYNLPDEWKTGHKHGRALFRNALQGLLPHEVLQGNKARNTFVVPVLKMEMEMYFTRLRERILSLSPAHRLFDYVDRRKLVNLENNNKTEARAYEMMRKLIMLAIFFDKQNNRELYEV